MVEYLSSRLGLIPSSPPKKPPKTTKKPQRNSCSSFFLEIRGRNIKIGQSREICWFQDIWWVGIRFFKKQVVFHCYKYYLAVNGMFSGEIILFFIPVSFLKLVHIDISGYSCLPTFCCHWERITGISKISDSFNWSSMVK